MFAQTELTPAPSPPHPIHSIRRLPPAQTRTSENYIPYAAAETHFGPLIRARPSAWATHTAGRKQESLRETAVRGREGWPGISLSTAQRCYQRIQDLRTTTAYFFVFFPVFDFLSFLPPFFPPPPEGLGFATLLCSNLLSNSFRKLKVFCARSGKLVFAS